MFTLKSSLAVYIQEIKFLQTMKLITLTIRANIMKILLLLITLTSCNECMEYKTVTKIEYDCLNPVDELSFKAKFNIYCKEKTVDLNYCSKYK